MKLSLCLYTLVTLVISVVLAKLDKRIVFVPINLGTGPVCDDVAIIGAGIGGTYAAWKLRNKNLSIAVYEYNNRTGGRLQTVHLPGDPELNIELGGMRFIPPAHTLLNKTAHDLGLSVIDFGGGVGFGDHDMAYLRGVHLRPHQFTGDLSPYKLKNNEKNKGIQELAWEIFVNGTNANSSLSNAVLQDEHFRFQLKTMDNMELYKQSYTAAYAKTDASSEAVKLLSDVFGFKSYTNDINAAVTFPRPRPPSSSVSTSTSLFPLVKTIKGGMDKIPKTLMEQFLSRSRRHRFSRLHDLKAIYKRSDGAYNLDFVLNTVTDGFVKPTQNQRTTCARNVILTVPRQALERINWNVLKTGEIHNLITKSVKDAPASKVFLVYDQPWWRNTQLNITHAVTDLPNRQTYDFGTSVTSSKSVLLASYTDMDDVKLWRELQKEGTVLDTLGIVDKNNAVSSAVVDVIHKYLAELYDIQASSIPAPVSGMMSRWDDVPYGAAWHTWMPGFTWKDVQHRIIKPSASDNVYISTGCFTGREASAWANNALVTVEEVLKRMQI